MSGTAERAEIGHGTKIGRFVVEGRLGAGGMGVVYAAHDRELDRRVALKVLRTEDLSDEAQRTRLLREGQAMARVTHANVITVHEVGVERGLVFLAQELLDGGTLGEWLREPRPRHEILEKFAAAGRGLAAAHAAGLVHRDFKPDNVLLGKDGRVRVADFGLARALEAVDAPTLQKVSGAHVDSLAETTADLAKSPMAPLTRTGTVMGTPLYMAPEQHNGEPADERSDQFSFCVALYQALYGAAPFPGQTVVALADAVLHGRIEPPTKGSHVPARLRRCLVRGLSLRPADRYPSMEALLAELAHDPRRRVRRLALVAGLLALVAVALVGGYVLRSRTSDAGIPARRTIAVLGFKNLTADAGIAWISSAVSELLATELAVSDDIRVTPAEEAQRARLDLQLPDAESFADATLVKIRQRLDADVIVIGSYRMTGGELTVSATVVDLARGRTRNVEVKGAAADLPGLAAQLGPKIRAELEIAAPSAPRVAHAVLPRDALAARAYTEGLAALREHDYPTAQRRLATATQREPDFAHGHLALARAHEGLFDGTAAHAAARKALALARTLPIDQQLVVGGEAHELLGEHTEARAQYRRLFALHPEDLEHGLRLLRVQVPADAPATIAALRKLPPPTGTDPRIDVAEAGAAVLGGDTQHALEIARRATEAARARGATALLAAALRIEGQALTALGDLTAAHVALAEARQLYETIGHDAARIGVLLDEAALGIDRGLLDGAYEKYEVAGAFQLQAGQTAQAAIARSASALALALRGDLTAAETRLRAAETQGKDANAALHVALVSATIASARADAAVALEASERCASGFATIERGLAALCWQLHGEVLAELGRGAAARAAYERGRALAHQIGSIQRGVTLALALAQLDIDDDQAERAIASLQQLLPAAKARGAIASAAQATVVLARAHLAEASSAEALELLEELEPQTIEPFEIRIQRQLTLGQAHAAMGDPVTALELIEAARADAERAGWRGLVFEARLARAEIQVRTEAEGATAEASTLLHDASHEGLGRIVRLAKTITER